MDLQLLNIYNTYMFIINIDKQVFYFTKIVTQNYSN